MLSAEAGSWAPWLENIGKKGLLHRGEGTTDELLCPDVIVEMSLQMTLPKISVFWKTNPSEVNGDDA